MERVSQATIDNTKAGIVSVIERYLPLERRGKDYFGLCPFHEEKSPSFTVNPVKEFFHCFGCGAGGDAVDFVQKYEGIGFREAVRRIAGQLPEGEAGRPARERLKAQREPEWEQLVPADTEAAPMSTINRQIDGKWHKIQAAQRWSYFTADGQLVGYVCRFNLPDGSKETIPQSLCVNRSTGEVQWRWQAFAKPRLLYGLQKLSQHPSAQVLVVEGEKTADAAQKRFEAAGIGQDRLVVVSWPGGVNAVQHADWSPLAGRAVALWPDADMPGMAAAVGIGDLLLPSAKMVKLIVPPLGVEKGWDLADELPAGFDLLAHVKTAVVLDSDDGSIAISEFKKRHPSPPQPAAAEATQETQEDAAPEQPAEPTKPTLPADEHADDLISNGYFTILGYDYDEYFFFQFEKRQVLKLRKGDFSDTGLIELAPINWWEEYFPTEKGGINKKAAVNWIFRTANSRGIYDPTRVRGRGAWIDKGRAVFHHGPYLTVDGVKTDITRIKSAYVYPMARSMPDPSDQPLTDEEGRKLVAVASKVRWTMPASAALMAGFTMLAPICGALQWRPHIWITGAPGSGKSTVQNKFCGALLRDMSLYSQGDSTEAGIRQELKADAIPVLIDEAESNNERDRQRIEGLIGLIRKTSTDSQAKTYKGTVSGDGQQFHIRSMFCLASINVNMPTKADVDRLTKLVIKSPDNRNPTASEAYWRELESELNAIDADTTLPSRLLARGLQLLPTILENIKVFRRVAAVQFGTQRDGDQFGTLLAGCWSLTNSTVVTDDEAKALIDQYDFKEHVEDHDQDDAMRALEAILAAKLRVHALGEFSVFELIRDASPEYAQGIVSGDVADATLRRHGIRAEFAAGELWFGTGVSSLKHLVEHMPFVTDLRGQLLRVPGASRLPSVKKFNGVDSKCVALPLKPILAGDSAPQTTFDTDDIPF